MIKIGFLNYSWTWASGPAECPIADMIPNSHVGFMHFFPGHFVSKCPALEISNLSRDLLPIVQWFFRPTIPTLLNTGHISLSLHKTWVSRLWSAWIATIKNGYTLENTEKSNPSHLKKTLTTMDTTIKVVSRKFMRSKETALLVSIDNHTWNILKMHFVEDMWMLPLVWDRTKPWRIYIRSTHDKRRWFQVVSVLSFEVVPPGAIHRCGIDYIYIYIWSRVKIVYGTFRGVQDVWNEGAS